MRNTIIAVIFLLTGSLAFAHNPNNMHLYFYQEGDCWRAELHFATSGLRDMMRAYKNDPKFLLEDTDQCKTEIEDYVRKRLSVNINKHIVPELESSGILLTHHAVRVDLLLEGIPPRAEFWGLEFDFNKDKKGLNHMLHFVLNGEKTSFLLKQEARISLRKASSNSIQRLGRPGN